MSSTAYDAFELSGIPSSGDTVGTSGADITMNSSEDTLSSPDLSSEIASGGTVEFQGTNYTVTSTQYVTFTADGAGNYDGYVISFEPVGGGATETVFIPDDSAGDLSFNTLTITSVTSVVSVSYSYVDEDNTFGPLCFAKGSKVLTPNGERPVESLHAGDLVLAADGRTHVLRAAHPSHFCLRRNPKHRPVSIPANALGQGLPRQRLLVSRQHRILIETPERLVLIPAKDLIGWKGIRLDTLRPEIDYVHLEFDSHVVLAAQGLPAESLLPERDHAKLAYPELRGQKARKLLKKLGGPRAAQLGAARNVA